MRFVLAVLVLLLAGVSQASYRFDFDIFTSDGAYHDSPLVDTYVVVSNGQESIVDFTFYNASAIASSVARIYFDDGSLLDIATLTNGPGTNFSEKYPGPGNLPSGNLIDFVADREFTIGALNPPPQDGVNPAAPDEWVRIRYNLVAGGDLASVIGELQSGELRVGIHIIGLPDGSSESAIMVVPEPATMLLLGLGALGLLKKHRA
jgi:hypothetical protein